jgi:gliding motility-associated-like protein
MQKVMLSNKGLSWPIYGQKNRSFTWGNGNWGYNDHGIITYYNNKYQNTGIYNSGSTSQIHLLQALKDTATPNCFYLVFPEMSYSSDTTTNWYLHLEEMCIDKNDKLTVTYLDKEKFAVFYAHQAYNNSAFNWQSGYMTRSNNGKRAYFHINHFINGNMYVYELYNKNLVRRSTFSLPAFPSVENAISISANSKVLTYSAKGYHITSDKYIYIHKLDDGYKLNPVPDTIRPYTYDTSQKTNGGISFQYVQLSPTGRYLYVIETFRGNKQYPSKINDSAGTYIITEQSTRLLQVDLAGLGKPGYTAKPRILKEWSGPLYNNNVFIHSVPIDGKLYFCVRQIKINPYSLDTAINLYRLNNIESDTVTYKSAELMAANLPYPLVYYDPETFDQNTWAQYPYQARANKACSGEKTSLWLHSTIPYDSVIWQTDSFTKFRTTLTDSLIEVNMPTGWHTITYYVYRNGYEDLLMKDIYVAFSAKKYDSLRILPRIVYGCKENETWLKPGKDTMAINANWADGTTGTDRKVTKSGKYVWRVYYKDSLCPRMDTVEVKITDWDSIKFTAINKCDTLAALLKIENLQPQIKWKWYNGDSLNTLNAATKTGNYCITLTDTLAHCSKQFCTEVKLYQSQAPLWAGKDTTICEGDMLEIKPDADYQLQCADGTGNINGSCIITNAGNYTFKYKRQTPEDICGWREAKLQVTVKTVETSENCYAKTNCKWFIPNAFSPDNDNLNEMWAPVCSCPQSTYKITIYNRWGEEIRIAENAGWNGLFKNGSLAPEGLYLYTIIGKQPDNKIMYFSGTIHLLH